MGRGAGGGGGAKGSSVRTVRKRRYEGPDGGGYARVWNGMCTRMPLVLFDEGDTPFPESSIRRGREVDLHANKPRPQGEWDGCARHRVTELSNSV